MKAKEFIIEQETGNVDDADSWQSQAADAARNAETVRMSQQDAAAGGIAEQTYDDECPQCQQELAEATQRLDPKCWTGYRKDGTKIKDGVRVNNCVKVSEDEYTYEGELSMLYEDEQLDEAEYQGRKVSLGKPMQGDVAKFKVYVKNEKGNVIKVNFGDKTMRIKKSNPARRKSFRARHKCATPGPRTKARYWSCRKW
jgi:hypothetical protein